MTDTRKMLEMAAKAMGYESRKFVRDKWTLEVLAILIAYPDSDSVKRNPHTDDGDCLRMIARLGIIVMWTYSESGEIRSAECSIMKCHGDGFFSREASASELLANHNNDPDASLRLCALRCAAMMGEQM